MAMKRPLGVSADPVSSVTVATVVDRPDHNLPVYLATVVDEYDEPTDHVKQLFAIIALIAWFSLLYRWMST